MNVRSNLRAILGVFVLLVGAAMPIALTAGPAQAAPGGIRVAVPVAIISVPCPIYYRDPAGVMRPRAVTTGCGNVVGRPKAQPPRMIGCFFRPGAVGPVLIGCFAPRSCPSVQRVAGVYRPFVTTGGCWDKVK